MSDQQDQVEPADPAAPDTGGEFQRLSPLTPVAKSGIWLAAAVFGFGREVLKGQERIVEGLVIGGGIVLLGIFVGLASWWRTRFRISATELRIDTGLLNRTSRRVRLDRIVSVDLNQPLVARLLGVSALRIETGTTESEAALAFLRIDEARRIRHTLLGSRSGDEDTGIPEEPSARLLVRVPLKWHLVALIASGEAIWLALVAVAFVVLRLLGKDLTAYGLTLAAIAGAGWSLVNKLIGRWNWELSAVPSGLQVKHGMFNVSTQTFHVARLQGLVVSEPLLWRPWGLATMRISVAGGVRAEDGEDNSGLLLPAAPRAVIERLATDLLGHDYAQIPGRPAGRHARWLAPLTAGGLRFGFDEQVLVVVDGLLSRRTSIAPLRRLQSVTVRRGPVKRLLGLANLHIDTPVGAISLAARLREQSEARRDLESMMRLARG